MANVNERPAIEIPDYALWSLRLLESQGHEAWFVGGSIRHALMGAKPGPPRIATSALWQDVEALFLKHGCPVHYTGVDHGTVTVVVEGNPFKITTFHGSEATCGPVVYAHDIETDLSHRDFTINALAYHPEKGLFDPFRGARDIRRGIIRCVGDPEQRFAQDPLRILRGIRLASVTGFAMTEETLHAGRALAERVAEIDAEHVRWELGKFLCGSYVHDAIMNHFDVLAILLPELVPMRSFDQRTRFHVYDVLEHTAYVVQHSKALVFNRWAALLHDTGKPETFYVDERGVGHMPEHPEASIKHLEAIAARLSFPKALVDDLTLVIRHHDDRPAPTREGTARLYANMGYDEALFYRECDLMKADSLSKAPEHRFERVEATNQIEELFETMKAEGSLPRPE